MNADELKTILNNPAVSPEQKARARAALEAQTDLHADTVALLTALQVSCIADLSDLAFERYHRANNLKANDPLVREFYWWVPPSPDLLRILGMSAREWWQKGCDLAVAAKRPDAEAFARNKLAEAGAVTA
jgi:hypothetical protein